MAKNTTTASDKPKAKRGPQKRVLHIFYRQAEDGSLVIENVMSDARKVLEYVDSPEYQGKGLKRFKYEIVSQPREDGGEDVTGSAAPDQDAA